MTDLIEITFLRHGRSLADDEEKFEGRYDSPLTVVGQAQARARGEGWRQAGVRFDRVICSTLQRARATAEIVAACLRESEGAGSLPVEPDPDWMEMDNGPLAGLTIAEGEARFPRPAFRTPYQPLAGSGESEIQLHARAARAVEKIVQLGSGRTLVVAHGGILNAALRAITGAPYPINFSGIWFAFSDLGYARFHYNPARHVWTMRELVR
jgi:2,3-bisphosphoglycerate-dependent phosphoglycerate mutase